MLVGGCADAIPAADTVASADLAARAVAEAKLMPPGRARDVTLRQISRNLRHAERRSAIDAARAMSTTDELRSFEPVTDPGPPRRAVERQVEQANMTNAGCATLIRSLAGSRPGRIEEARVRECLHLDEPSGIVARPLPPFDVLMTAAGALPPGRTKADLLYMATWDGVPDRPARGARDAIRRWRALLPDLDGELRREAERRLDTVEVDLIEGRPDAAIARVKAAMRRAHGTSDRPFDDAADQVQGLVGDLLRAKDVARAVAVTELLPPSADCAQVYENLPAILQLELSQQMDENVVSAYLDRLQATGCWVRLCPHGIDQELAAEAWLTAGNEAKALEVATVSGRPIVVAKTSIAIIDRRLSGGDIANAKAMTAVAADSLPSLSSGPAEQRSVAARLRVRLIYQLMLLGKIATAERLASGYPGPGWRGFAYSVIVATADRARAMPDWGAPLLELEDVAADL